MWGKGKKKEKGKENMKKIIKYRIDIIIINIKLGLIKIARFFISGIIKILDIMKVGTE